jgi:hypothetical protein
MAHIIEQTNEYLKKGVGTYNKDNRDNKENKNNYCLGDNNPFLTSSVGLASNEAPCPEDLRSLSFSQERGALLHLSKAAGPTPLDADQIKSCVFQLFDNGETARQRYKFKIRLNLTDKTNPEFIASLTKDFRNFKKYIPEPYRDDIIQMVTEERHRIKKLTGSFPYCGKLHLNTGMTGKKQIEPDTLVVIWWNPEDKGWSGAIKFQNWAHEFDLFTERLTDKQKAIGVKCQDNWQNPKHDKTVRPLTWAQQRGLA